MMVTVRSSAIGVAAVAVMGWGFHEQWLLPKPTYDPFDGQWVTRARQIAHESDAVLWGACGYQSYVRITAAGMIGYEHHFQDPYTVTGKSLLALADTVRWDSLRSVHALHDHRSRYAYDSCAVADLRIELLDEVVARYGLLDAHDVRCELTGGYERRYLTPGGDTARFVPVLDFEGLSDTCLVRRGYLAQELRPRGLDSAEAAGAERWGSWWYYVRQLPNSLPR